MANRREDFLEYYLQLFGAIRIEWTNTEADTIYGKIIYSDNTEQDFCWHMLEQNIPSEKVINLIQVIITNKFIDADRITVSLDELFLKSNEYDYKKFKKTMRELLNIDVSIIDNGIETDSFFLH